MEALGRDRLVAALGLSPEVTRFYLHVLPLSGRSVADIRRILGIGQAEFDVLSADLIASGSLRIDGEIVEVLQPSQALSHIIESAAERARRAYEQLLSVSRAVPHLVADSTRDPQAEHEGAIKAIDGEVVHAGSAGETLSALIERTTGELRWLRPDQWTLPWEETMRDLIAHGIEEGRRVRGIYPVRALNDAPAVLQARSDVGEEIRLLPEVPTRLLVIGTSHAVFPEPLGGTATTPRVVARQRSVVEAFVLLFEQLWVQASPLVEYARGGNQGPEIRRQLLLQMAAGAQDEQIARRLGMSLRTVRRRVAELMAELGAESRFQAGVEAARRRWL